MSSSQTFYPEPGPAGDDPWPRPPGRALAAHERIHAPPSDGLPLVPVSTQPRRPWGRSLGLCVVLSATAGVLDVSLGVLLGQEILAASILFGLLAGAGMRLGGLEDRWSVAFCAAAIAMAAWVLASSTGAALLRALDAEHTVASAFQESMGSPGAIMRTHADEPLVVTIAAVLIAAGAVVSTATFTRSRTRRRAPV